MKDVSIMLDIMAGPDRYDNLTYEAVGQVPDNGYLPEVTGKQSLRGMKLGLLWNPYWATGAVSQAPSNHDPL